MVQVNVRRFAIEVLAASPESIGLHRQSVEVLVRNPGANANAGIFVRRLGAEVLAETPDGISLHRQSAEVLVENPGANAAATIFIPRLAVEVLAEAPDPVALHRQSAEVIVSNPGANPGASIFVRRVGVEVLAGVPPTVTPLDLPDSLELFLHNWTSVSSVDTVYSTSIDMAENTIAEERRSLSNKPIRAVTVDWMAKDRAETDKLFRLMRNVTKVRWAVPMFPDQRRLTAAVTTATTTIYCDTTDRRFYAGINVVLVETDKSGSMTGEFLYRQVTQRFSDRLILDSSVSSLPLGFWLVIPLLNAELLLEPDIVLATNYIATATFTFDEVAGASAFPPAASGNPGGFPTLEGIPIWTFSPDWKSGLKHSWKREGEIYGQGRDQIVYARGDRARLIQDHPYLMERDEAFSALKFFDSRRGRAWPFFQIDQEDIWDVVSIQSAGGFIGIDPFGDFDDFQEELDYIGLIMSDGTYYVRPVISVQSVLGVWRVTVSPVLPTGLSVANVKRVARARKVRFAEDAWKEEWTTTEVMTTKVKTIEVLNEGEVTL